MVVPLGPGKFYGSSLPRPRYYTDIKLNTERVDPPTPVLDPLLSWANEAHWSMGGLSFQHLRLQGRIEGNIKKLRAENEKVVKNRKRKALDDLEKRGSEKSGGSGWKREASLSPSPPPAPISKKRRRLMTLIDDDEEEEEVGEKEKVEGVGIRIRRRSARKLGDEFDRVASEDGLKGNQKFGVSDDDDDNLGEIKGGLLKSKMMRAAENLSNGSNAVASRTRGKKSDDGVVGSDVDEDVKGLSVSKGKKLKKIGEKRDSIGAKSLSPATAIRTSPRLTKNRESSLV